MTTPHTLYCEFVSGRNESFTDFVNCMTPRMYGFFKRLGAAHHDAEDLCQELFAVLYRSKNTYRAEHPVMPWIFTIARNLFCKLHNSQKLKIVKLGDYVAAPVYENKTGDIEKILGKLSFEKRVVFEMKQFQNLKFSEIAEILEIAEGTAKSRMFAAVKELAEILKRSRYAF